MILLAILCKQFSSRNMLLVMLLLYGLHMVTCKDDAPPCFGIISPYIYDMIEPQFDRLRDVCVQIVCKKNSSDQNPKHRDLPVVTIKATRIDESGKLLCLHASIHLSNVTHQNIEIIEILEEGRLYHKYHTVLQYYTFPFEHFVPHTHWSPPPDNQVLFVDKGLFIDGQYYCKPDHINILPWQHVSEMSEHMLIKFIVIMNQLVDDEFVRQHYRIDHYDPLSFFVGHRHYVACVEQELSRHGVPMPYWSPETTVPPLLQGVKRSPIGCLTSVLCIEGWFDLPIYSTNISLPTPEYFHPERICEIETLDSLFTLVREWHSAVHAIIGGSFTYLESPASLLFFPYHNYIDKFIYKYWQENC